MKTPAPASPAPKRVTGDAGGGVASSRRPTGSGPIGNAPTGNGALFAEEDALLITPDIATSQEEVVQRSKVRWTQKALTVRTHHGEYECQCEID